MQSFFAKYPRVGETIVACLVLIVGWFVREALNNNTLAMNRVVAAVETLTDKVNGHEVKLAEHDIRLRICEGP